MKNLYKAFDGLKQGPYKKILGPGSIAAWKCDWIYGTAKAKIFGFIFMQFYLAAVIWLTTKGTPVAQRSYCGPRRIDLKLHPKAIAVIDRNKVSSLFPWEG
jgi:hypothetical protein